MNTHFYSSLPSITNFHELTKIQNYTPVPDDWYVIVTDTKGSTKAIEEGRYKDVNFVGAMSIVALLNLSKEVEIPFLFGGDGATILIPSTLYKKTCSSLNNIRSIVKNNFGFELRIGIIEAKEIYKDKKELLITKHEVSKNYTQAIVRGGGIEYADYLIKNHYETYTLKHEDQMVDYADFESLECRWEEIKSPKDEVLSILIKANDTNSDTIYQNVFKELDAIFGNHIKRNPIKKQNLVLSFDPSKLKTEASLYASTFISKIMSIFKMQFINLIGKVLMDFKIGEWASYKNNIVQTSDTQKFDDIFRTVISATKKQTRQLELYLQSEFEKGNLNYGIHKSEASLMTCLIFQRHGKHVHFVDGSNGGYTLAAKDMKSRAMK